FPLFSKADNLRLVLGMQFAGAVLAGAAWTQMVRRAHQAELSGTEVGRCPATPAHWTDALAGSTLFLTSLAIAAVVGMLLVVHDRYSIYSHLDGLYQLWTDPTVPSPLQHRSLRTLVSFVTALVAVLWSVSCWRWLSRQQILAPPRWPGGSL